MSLHVHSEFSSLDGWSKIDEIANRMVEINCPFCGLTDHGVVSGHLEFDKVMRSKGLNPVFGCLLAGQSIVTSTGRKNIEEIKVGDLVLTHKGRFRKVTRIMKRSYQGRGYEIEIAQSKRSLTLTEEHPILVRDDTGIVDWKKPGDIRATTKWEGGGNLNGEYVCLPKLENDSATIHTFDWLPAHFTLNDQGEIGRHKQKKGDRDVFWSFPKVLELTPQLARFLGLYVAEGSAKDNGHITFTFHLEEKDYADFVMTTLAELGIKAKIYERPSKSTREVVACHVPLALLLLAMCGKGAHSKRVPLPILTSNQSLRKDFLQGLNEGDGKKASINNALKVSSRDLCWGVRTLLADLGYWTSVVDLGPYSYQVQWNPDRQYSRTAEDKEYIYRMIREVRECNLDCMVYNVEVEEDNSYISDFTLHNCEIYHGINFTNLKGQERDQSHLIALAMTDEGLKNLWRLVNSTARPEKFHQVGRVSCEDIIRYKEGIIFTSACPLGLVPKGLLKSDTTWLNWYLDNLGDNFRLEITTYPGDAQWGDMDSDLTDTVVTPQIINELIVNAAQERGVLLTYGDDGHYAFPSDFERHDMYLASQTKQSIYTPLEERKMYHPPNAVCIKDLDMVHEALHYLPEEVVNEAIDNTMDIGNKADAHLPNVERPHMPVFIPSECPWVPWAEKVSATDLFVTLVEKGISQRYTGSEREAEAWTKAAHEMEVLIEDGLEHYFLMAWDVVQFCELEGIKMGPGRGSSAGSIVAYALGITDVDPLHYELYFERFWNKGRTDGFPDIDSDFARARRPKIREYLIDRWGEDRVCSIGTIARMKPIEAIQQLAKACEIDFTEEGEIKKIVKETHQLEIHGHEQIGWNPEIEPGKVIYVKNDVGEKIDEWVGDNPIRSTFINMCEHACSRNSNYGIHPSGIVVADIPLADYAPAYLRGGKAEGIPATLFPMKDIEKLLLLKLDVLGLKTLDALDEWDKQMAESGVKVEWSGLDREEHPEEMWDLLEEGFVAGIFQIETRGGKALTEKIKPRSVHDLGILVSLIRPGPDEKEYIARKEGRKEIVYQHPILEPILENTYGMFIYQEQIIRFMSDLGYNLNDADAMRKILGKKQPEKLSDIFEGFNEWDQNGFLKVAMEKGFTEEIATKVWADISEFASYSFNKSHSIAYGIIAFRCLYAKYYGSQQWYIACIRTVENSKRAEHTPQYIKEARRMGIEVLPPDVRFSQHQVAVHDDSIYFGFGDIKGVGSGGEQFVHMRDNVGLNITSPDVFLSDLNKHNEVFLAEKKQALKDGEPFPTSMKSPKQLLNEKKVQLIYDVGGWDALGGAVDLKTKQKFEEELLSVVLTDNAQEVLKEHTDEIEHCDEWDDILIPWAEKESEYDWTFDDGEEIPISKRFIQYKIPGIITSVKPTKVKSSGARMGIVTMEYGRHELTFACFSNRWKGSNFLFKPRSVGIFTIYHSAPNDKYGEGYHFESGHLLK
jgi:DNA polymerase III subunit alpha